MLLVKIIDKKGEKIYQKLQQRNALEEGKNINYTGSMESNSGKRQCDNTAVTGDSSEGQPDSEHHCSDPQKQHRDVWHYPA